VDWVDENAQAITGETEESESQTKPKLGKKPSPTRQKPIPRFPNLTGLLAYLQEGEELLVKIDAVEQN